MSLALADGLSELEIVQNPAIGAFMIWHFALGYQEDGAEAVPIPLVFLVLPLLLHRPTFDAVASTRKASGLGLFAAKFAREREILMALHDRALQLRALSLQSVGVAATARLLRVDYPAATVRGFPPELLGKKNPVLPERLKGFMSAPEKVGYWFSKLGIAQIAATLRIDF
ncbi:MAG TPA: three component ABC system middle component [Allosphingosinicella sp.]|nr:three component ABC system middle component [Allosphingosinicella sp.]